MACLIIVAVAVAFTAVMVVCYSCADTAPK